MNINYAALDWRLVVRDLAITIVFNTVIAAFLTYFLGDAPFASYLVISQAIGISSCLLCIGTLKLFQPQSTLVRIAFFGFSILSGGLLGGSLGGWITGVPMVGFLDQKAATLQTIVLSLIFGSTIGYFFFSRRTLALTREEVQQERIQRLTSEKLATQAQLKMLQAQIEPHFLFNTLSNVLSLLDGDAARGKAMLTDLTRFLRATLDQARAPRTDLGGEVALSAAYLNILKVRMGARLSVRIDIPEALKPATFAPMLLQPLVENAVIHGIDPQIEGGEIGISAQKEGARLRVTVADTGCGLKDHKAAGMGITNIRERLNALYGKNGRLIFAQNQPRGVLAVIEVPYADPS